MKLPLPRSRRARLLAAVGLLAAAGATGGAVALSGGGAAASAAPTADGVEHPRWLLTVDEAALPEAPVPADAGVVQPEGADGLLSLEQLDALDGATVVRDVDGRLRVVQGDWRAGATAADRVAGLPGILSVEPAAGHSVLVESDLTPEQLAGLPGVVAVATEDGSPVPAQEGGTAEAGTGGGSAAGTGAQHGSGEAPEEDAGGH